MFPLVAHEATDSNLIGALVFALVVVAVIGAGVYAYRNKLGPFKPKDRNTGGGSEGKR